MHDIRPIEISQVTPDIEIIKTKIGWTIFAYFGKVQAKDTLTTSEELFIGVAATVAAQLHASVFADELSSPATSIFTLKFTVKEHEFPIETLVK